MTYTFTPKNTCSTKIEFSLDGDVVHDIRFTKGCNGNLKAIAALCDGLTVGEIEKKLKGIMCSSARNTSCADQLAAAVMEAYTAK